MESNNSFVQLIINAAESHRDKKAMQVIGESASEYTFGEMLDRVRSIAFRLEKEGIGFGEKVALIGENSPRWAISYLGMLYRGAVCVPLDPHGEIETLTNFIENSEAKMAFIGKEFVEEFRKIEERLGRQIPAVVLQDVESSNGFQSFSNWANTPRPSDFDSKAPPAKPEDIAVLMYTSGTTGTPKGVPLTHGNIFYETTGVQEVVQISENEVILSVLPLFHVFAQVANLWIGASIGARIDYVKELSPAELERAFKTGEVTLLTGVPRLWYMFHKKIFDGVAAQPKPVQILFNQMLRTNAFLRDNFNVNLGKKFFKKVHDAFGGNLDITISAGSRFDEKIARDYHALGFTLIQGYGLTETTGAVASTLFHDNKVGSVGKPVKYAEIKIGDPNEEGIGEVLIRGGQVFHGYYKNPEATREVFTEDGWFRSGDLGKFDKEGNLYIVGRSKDVIVLPSGKNVHPEDIEVHYSKSPLVGEMCVLGVKDTSSNMAGAEKLVAVVVPDFEYLKQNNIANSREAIRHYLDGLGRELPEYQRVRDYIVRTEPLPRTATRKVRRFEVQKEIESGKYGAGELKPAKAREFTVEDRRKLDSTAGRTLTKIISQNTKDAEELHPEMYLEIDLGLDSLGRAEVFAALEQAFGIEFDSDEAAQALTVGDVIELTQKHAGGDNAEIVSTDFNWGDIVQHAAPNETLPEVQYLLRDRIFFPVLAFTVYKIFNLFCRIFLRLEVENAAVLEKLERPFLICPNHQSFLDPFVVSSNYPFRVYRHIFHVGAAEYFKSFPLNYLGRLLNVVPINPDSQIVKAMKAGAIGLKNGKVLNIYPEGERAFDGHLHEFKKGAAILSTELDLPIVPVALDGLYKVWARKSKKIRLSKVKVRFGAPIYPREFFKDEAAINDETKYERLTAHLKETIAEMIEDMRR